MENNSTQFLFININAEIFLDPLLTDSDKVMIALMQTYRWQIMYESDPEKRNILLNSLRVSKFSRARGKHRDHVRRQLKEMQKNPEVSKYLKLFFLKDKLNTEDRIVIHFNDVLPDQLKIITPKPNGDKTNENKLSWQDEELIKSYIKNSSSKIFSGESPYNLLEVSGAKDSRELVKGLIYVEARSRRKPIKNPMGYLTSCFGANGLFKYDATPIKYIPKDHIAKINDGYEYEITKDNFKYFQESLENKYGKKFNFYFIENGNDKVYLKRLTKAGRDVNPRNWLKRYDVDFQIVNRLLEVSNEN